MLKAIFIFFIKIYQITLSPQKGALRQFWLIPCSCQFSESCSDFAIRQIKEKGIAKGCCLALKRIGQCHSFNKYKLK